MRNLIIFGMMLAAASAAGWFQVNRNGDNTTIEIDRAEIRNDARAAIDRGREFLDSREQSVAENQTDQTQQPWDAQQPYANPNSYSQPYQQPASQYSQESYPQPSYTYPQQGGYQPAPAYPSQANSYDQPRR